MNREQKKAVAWGTLFFTVTGIAGACNVPNGANQTLIMTIIVWTTIAVATAGVVLLLSETKK